MSLSETLTRIITFFEDNAIPYAIIGAYALAHFGRIRASLDIDIAVAVKPNEFRQFCELLKHHQFSIALADPRNPCFVVVDEVVKTEIEIWRNLDGVSMDDVITRRWKITTPDGLNMWIIDPESFIVNKLARPDRRAIDEADVFSVLKAQADKLDYAYLYDRAEQAKVLELLNSIRKRA